jgi:hypothetical protein
MTAAKPGLPEKVKLTYMLKMRLEGCEPVRVANNARCSRRLQHSLAVASLKRLCTALLAILLVSGSAASSLANTQQVDAASVPKLTCLYNLLRSNKAVESLGLYRIDPSRLAVEFSFHDPDYGIISDDIMLYGNGDSLTYGLQLNSLANLSDELHEEKALRAAKVFSSLKVSDKCSLVFALDDVLPFAKPRAQWQQIDWPNQPPKN